MAKPSCTETKLQQAALQSEAQIHVSFQTERSCLLLICAYLSVCIYVHYTHRAHVFYMCINIYFIHTHTHTKKNHLVTGLVTSSLFKQFSFLSLTSFSCVSLHPVPFFILFHFLSCDGSEWVTLPGIKNMSWQYFLKLIPHQLMWMKLTSALSFLWKRNICPNTSSFLEGEGGGENPFH